MGIFKLNNRAYSRKIIGYSFRLDLTSEGCIDALNMAIKYITNQLFIIQIEVLNIAQINM